MAAPQKKTRKTGRPKKPQSEAKDDLLRIRLSKADKALLDQAAKTKNLDTSTWARSELITMAKTIIATTTGSQ